MDDDELLEAVASGDDRALRELYDRHSPWVASRLRRSLPPDAVEDVLQETWVAIWRGARTYKREGRAGGWVWGIARRQAAMWGRKHGRIELELGPDLPARGDSAADAVRSVDLAGALEALGPEGNEQRELVRLVWEEDRSVADVACLLSVPEGTVKSRVYRLRRSLQAALRQGGYGA